jgi:hypothetical protein
MTTKSFEKRWEKYLRDKKAAAVKRKNSGKKRVRKALKKYVRKNAPRSRSISLKGFTGTIRQLEGGGLDIMGRGKRK